MSLSQMIMSRSYHAYKNHRGLNLEFFYIFWKENREARAS